MRGMHALHVAVIAAEKQIAHTEQVLLSELSPVWQPDQTDASRQISSRLL